MPLHRTIVMFVYSFVLLLILQSALFAKEKSAVDLLPPSTVIYAEISDPAKLWDVILKHPIGKQVMEMDAVKKGLAKPEMTEMKKGIAYVEQQIGMTWQEGLSTVTGGGMTIAVDAKTEGVAIFVKSNNQKTLEQLRDIFIGIAQDDAKKKEKPDPIKKGEYRGITVYQTGKAKFVIKDKWLMIVNKKDLGESILDAYLDGTEKTLANHPQFQQAKKENITQSTAWVYFDVETIRKTGVAEKLYREKHDQPLIEMLLGGVLGGLQKTPYVTSSLFVNTKQVKLSIKMPHKTEWITEKRQYFFGKEKQGVAEKRLVPKESILTLSTHRNFSGMWLNSSELFVDKIDAGFAKANSTLTTLFSGKDFGEKILGSLGPKVQLVVTRQTFAEKSPVPAIKLPSFAMVFTLKDAENTRDDMRRTFQSLLGFLNVVGAQEEGSPQLDIDTEKSKEVQIVIAKYIPVKGKENDKKAKIHFNFSPTFAFLKDKMILSSTTPLARELVQLVQDGSEKKLRDKQGNLNTDINLQVPSLIKILNDNRNQLIVKNMLEDGKDRKETEQEFDLISKMATWFDSSSIQLITKKELLKLDWQINLKGND